MSIPYLRNLGLSYSVGTKITLGAADKLVVIAYGAISISAPVLLLPAPSASNSLVQTSNVTITTVPPFITAIYSNFTGVAAAGAYVIINVVFSRNLIVVSGSPYLVCFHDNINIFNLDSAFVSTLIYSYFMWIIHFYQNCTVDGSGRPVFVQHSESYLEH